METTASFGYWVRRQLKALDIASHSLERANYMLTLQGWRGE